MTWPEVEALERGRCVPILPLGAIEAHGPHLPLHTDVIIAEAMAAAGAERLAESGLLALLLPTVTYTSAGFASAFAGTISPIPASARGAIVGVGRSLARQGFSRVVLANSHLDPLHLGSIRAAVDMLDGDIEVIFPDITRKPWALRLTDEFRSGACHAGQYETSIVMAAAPEQVREDARANLEAVPASLSAAIRSGKTSFEAAGGPDAYFGYPAQASAEEGATTIAVLGDIISDAVLQTLEASKEEPA